MYDTTYNSEVKQPKNWSSKTTVTTTQHPPRLHRRVEREDWLMEISASDFAPLRRETTMLAKYVSGTRIRLWEAGLMVARNSRPFSSLREIKIPLHHSL
jgi:hypothetical protein